MTLVDSAGADNPLQQQIELLNLIIGKATRLYNSKLKTVSIWITAENEEQTINELLHFPEAKEIPAQIHDFLLEYCLFLVKLRHSILKDCSNNAA